MPQFPGSSRLFPDAPAGPPGGVHIANIDGASRGNPGPASYALILKDPSGKIIFQLGKRIGRQTNNVAEYYALLAALDYATGHGIRGLRIRSDSELLVQQMRGRYKVKSADLRPLYERASKLMRQLDYFAIEHVPREMNREADALANQALDGGATHYEGAHASAATGPPATPPLKHGNSEDDTETPSESHHSTRHHSATSRTRTIRARIVNGTLVPSETLDLPEGSEVVLTIRKAQ
jgi:ribonuclease HI